MKLTKEMFTAINESNLPRILLQARKPTHIVIVNPNVNLLTMNNLIKLLYAKFIIDNDIILFIKDVTSPLVTISYEEYITTINIDKMKTMTYPELLTWFSNKHNLKI